MKLKALITKLEKIREEYVRKHGVEPVIWSWSEDGIELCAGTKPRDSGGTYGKKPYMEKAVRLPGEFG